MSRNFELLQQTSSVQELFETAENPAVLVGTAESEPRPTWSEKQGLFETAENPAVLVGTAESEPRPTWSEKPGLFETAENPAGPVGAAESEPRPTWSEKPEQKAVKSEALPIHLADLIRQKARRWGQQVQKQTNGSRTDLEAISRE